MPPYQLSVKALIWIADSNGGIKPIAVHLDSSPLNLENLVAYHQYRVHVTVGPNTLPGIRHMLRSNEVTFKTLVKSRIPQVIFVLPKSYMKLLSCPDQF